MSTPTDDSEPGPVVPPEAGAAERMAAPSRGVAVKHLLVLLAVWLLLWVPRAGDPIDLRYDAGVYYTLGAALAQGKGYRLLNEPGEIRAVQYPPLLPAIVALHARALGTVDPRVVGVWLQATFAAASLAYVAGAYALARPLLPPTYALVAALVCLLHAWFVFLSGACFAEVPFAALSMAFLLLTPRETRAWHTVRNGLLAGAAYLLRTLGVALLAAWVGEALLRKRYRQAALRATLAAIPVLSWQGYVASVRASHDYGRVAYAYQRAPYQYYNVSYAENLRLLDPFTPERGPATFTAILARTAGNAALIPATLGEWVSAVHGYWDWALIDVGERVAPGRLAAVKPVTWTLAWAPLLGLGALVVAGLVHLWWRGERLLVLYAAGTMALICLTPWPQQFQRYLMPLAPVASCALITGALKLGARTRTWARWGNRVAWLTPPLIMSLVVMAQLYALGRLYRPLAAIAYHAGRGSAPPEERRLFYDDSWRSFDAALAWLAEHSNAGDIVATSAPHWTYLQTGLHAVQPPFESDVATAQRLLETVPVTYLVVDAFIYPGGDVVQRYAAPVVRAKPENWEQVFSSVDGTVVIYRRAEPRADLRPID